MDSRVKKLLVVGVLALGAVTCVSTAQAQSKADDQTANDSTGAISSLYGKHITLYTDLPLDDEIRSLIDAFDQAVPQWCKYFGIEPSLAIDWHITGHLMRDRQRFIDAGRLPRDLPKFSHGYQRGEQLWLFEQPSAYYRRHLLLHEGTHGFMNTFLGGTGPPWYMEGMAELLGTHRWQKGRLGLKYFPQDKRQTPYWGRIDIIRRARLKGQEKSLLEVMRFDATAHRDVSAYAWCWAATAFLDAHPKSRDAFRGLRKEVRTFQVRFNRALLRELEPDWNDLQESWRVFIDEIEFGYSVRRATISSIEERPLTSTENRFTVRTDHGWQSSGFRVSAGSRYRINATGRFQVAQPRGGRTWWCEPGGVTIEYYRGRPLGILLAAVQNGPSTAGRGLLKPIEIGLEQPIVADQDGTLFFRINEMPGNMADNEGTISVSIERLPQESVLQQPAGRQKTGENPK